MDTPEHSVDAIYGNSDRNNDWSSINSYSSLSPIEGSTTNYEDDDPEPIVKNVPKTKNRLTTISKLAEMEIDPKKTYHMMSVLPHEFEEWVENEHEVPRTSEMPLKNVYPVLASILDCPDYVVNRRTFWYLDIIAAALDHAQKDIEMEMKDQKLLIAWFGHLFKLFLEKGWTREEILSNTRNEIIALGYNLENISWAVPNRQQTKNYLITGETNLTNPKEDDPRNRTITMAYITSLIYDVFANPFQFHLIHNVFFKPPEITDVKMPHKINFPKSYKPTMFTRREKIKKEDRKSLKGGDKIKEATTERKSVEEDTNEYILPLRDAVSKEFFVLLFGNKDKDKDKDKDKEPKDKVKDPKDKNKD